MGDIKIILQTKMFANNVCFGFEKVSEILRSIGEEVIKNCYLFCTN